MAVGSAWWTVLEVLLLHLWQNKCLAVKLTLSDGRNWNIFHKKGDQDHYWKKGIENIDPPTGLRYRVSTYRKFLLSVSCGYRGRSNSATKPPCYAGYYIALGWNAYSTKYGIFENTRKSRPMPEFQCIYQKHENKGTTTPRTNS